MESSYSLTKKKDYLMKSMLDCPAGTSDNHHWLLNYLPPCLLGILTFLSYYPSLFYPFQFDDLANIAKKFDIRFYEPLSWKVFFRPRWMSQYLNRLNYQMSKWWCGDGFDPLFYRLFNLGIHLTAGLLLFILIHMLLKRRKHDFLGRNSYLIAFITSGLFLLHPVQTQAVSYVIQARLECLASLCMIATLLCLTMTRAAKTTPAKIVYFLGFFTFGLISCGTKEIAIITPLLIIITDWFFFADQTWHSFKKRLGIYLGLGAMVIGIFWYYHSLRWFTDILLLKSVTTNNRGNILTELPTQLITPLRFLISEFKVILHYLLMYIWPFELSVEYDWKLASSFFAPDAFFPFIALAGIAWVVIYHMIQKKRPYLTFGLLWFFIAIAPRSSIIPSSELICDYKAYPASIGWLFVLGVWLAMLIEAITNNLRDKTIESTENKICIYSLSILSIAYASIASYEIWHTPASYKSFACLSLSIPIGIAALIVYLRANHLNKKLYSPQHKSLFCALFLLGVGYSSLQRNKVWHSPRDFWADIIKKAPLKARGYNNYGVALSEEGDYDQAIASYKKAIDLDPYYSDPHSNLAVAYSMLGNIDDAIISLQSAIRITPNYPEAYNNLGTLLLQKKEYAQAQQAFEVALSMRSYYGKAYFNLARLHLEQHDEETAWTCLKKATEGDLDTEVGFTTLGQMSLQLKKYPQAAHAFEQAIRLGGQKKELLFNLANAYFMCRDLDKALPIYQQLTAMDAHHSGYWYNCAETLYSMGRYDEALECFTKSSRCPEPLAQSHLRIANSLELLGNVSQAQSYLAQLLNYEAPEEFKTLVKNEISRMTNSSTT